MLITAMPEDESLLQYGENLWGRYEKMLDEAEEADHVDEGIHRDLPFFSGLSIGTGSNKYFVARITDENIVLQKEKSGTERFIPVKVIQALCNALLNGTITLSDLERRQNTNATHVFDKIGLNHDKFIMGYDASIIKLCEYFIEYQSSEVIFKLFELLQAYDLISGFAHSDSLAACSSLFTKKFLILTGLSGSGKTLQALSFAKWITAKTLLADGFKEGAEITSSNVTYHVAKSDRTSVEFWNSSDASEAIKVTLPREMIQEWADYIRENAIPKKTLAREIREAVKGRSRFSDQLHSFETHLKAAAFALLENQVENNTIQQFLLISVGADWTSNENLLGYPDALKEKSYRKPDNGVLDLILNAEKDPEHPYFLILDEMNLSHVERYFADFLSAMESGEPIHLHEATGEDWDGVPAKLTIPDNLFVIGTVNVDETTYMFSPKVLDRANVIEFRVEPDEMEAFLSNPVKPDLESIAGQGAAYAKAFTAAAKQKDVPLDEELRPQISGVLMAFFTPLQEAGAEFGYRTAHEICRFVYFHRELSGGDWSFEAAMDAAVMQKLLPKLHGSKKKLGPVLASLIRLCLNDSVSKDLPDPLKDEVLIQENAKYPVSLAKLKRMRQRLAEHGFTSFAEA